MLSRTLPAPEQVSVPEIIVDMGDDHTSRMAQIAMDNCAAIYDSMNDYIHAVFMVNQLFQYVEKNITYARNHNSIPTKVYEILDLLQNPRQRYGCIF